MANGQWQGEERPPNFPLGNGQPTQITAAVNDQTIDIFANKKQFCYSYRHRYDVSKVNKILGNGHSTPIKVWVGKVSVCSCTYYSLWSGYGSIWSMSYDFVCEQNM